MSNIDEMNPKKKSRDPFLDIVRIFACFIVLLHHAAVALTFGEEAEAAGPIWFNIRLAVLWMTKYGSGTPIFFALAGWLVMNTLDKSEGDRRAIARSFSRRIGRIIPPYWLALGLTAGLILILETNGLNGLFAGGFALEFQSPTEMTIWQWIGNLTLTETWRPLFMFDHSTVFTRVAWSLCYHEQFIAIAVLCAFIAGSFWRKALGFLTFSLLLLQILIFDMGAMYRVDGLFIDRWFCFAVGLMSYEIAHLNWKDWHKSAYLGIIFIGGFAGLFWDDQEMLFSATTAILLGLCSKPIQWRLSSEWENRFARMSHWTYPIFLVHLPIVTICNRVLFESGLQSFWARALIIIPTSMLMGVIAGIAFGRFVNLLDSITIETAGLNAAFNGLFARLHPWLLQIWRVVAIEPILFQNLHIFPRPARSKLYGHLESESVTRLSDRTPWPNATR
jgi:peptidoglycan/LPS O-acetylase OafA/YrhL